MEGDQDKIRKILSLLWKGKLGIRPHLEIMIGMSKITLREGDWLSS